MTVETLTIERIL